MGNRSRTDSDMDVSPPRPKRSCDLSQESLERWVGMIDSRRGPPFKPGGVLGTLDGKLFLVVLNPGGDLSAEPDEEGPNVQEAAQLASNFLSFYSNSVGWRGIDCYEAERVPAPPGSILAQVGVLEWKKTAARPFPHADYRRMKVVAASQGRGMEELRAYMAARG